MIKKGLLILCCALSIVSLAQNKNLSNGVVFDGEPFITINPNNSQHLVVAWMGMEIEQHYCNKNKSEF